MTDQRRARISVSSEFVMAAHGSRDTPTQKADFHCSWGKTWQSTRTPRRNKRERSAVWMGRDLRCPEARVWEAMPQMFYGTVIFGRRILDTAPIWSALRHGGHWMTRISERLCCTV